MTDETHRLYPENAAQLVELIRQAATDGEKLRLRGVVPAGLEPQNAVRNVLFSEMATVVDYPARDMTITVEAGLPLNELQKILAEENQQLPIDSADGAATVGSLVAGDVAGSRQYGYGSLRDYVIGIEAVDGRGRIFHAGGRVVKNVAGYDLCRLMVGSRGMLAALTQLTFKLKPKPEHSLLRVFRFDDREAFSRALDRLNTSAATPVVLDFSYASAAAAVQRAGDSPSTRDDLPYALHIGVEGTEQSCDWQISQLRNECSASDEIPVDGHDGSSTEQHGRGFLRSRTHVRICCLPSRVAGIAAALADRGCSTVGHAGNGIVYVGDEQGDGRARSVCEEVATAHDAMVSEWDVDHPANAGDSLTDRLRAAFDPNSVFVQS